MKLVGANPEPQAAGIEELPGKINYFIGSDPEKWQAGVPTYSRVKFENVSRGGPRLLRQSAPTGYDFVVAPGAKHNAIELAFEGADRLKSTGGEPCHRHRRTRSRSARSGRLSGDRLSQTRDSEPL